MLYLVGEGQTWSSTCFISLGRVTHGVVHVISRWGWLHMESYMFYLVWEGYTWSSTCCISLGDGYTWSSTCHISLRRVTHGVVHVVSRLGGLHME